MKFFSKLLLIVFLAFGLLVPQTGFATSDVQGASSKEHYLVQFNGEAVQQGLLQAFGVEGEDIVHTFSLFPVVTLSLTEQQAKGLANHPAIKAVEKDQEVRALQSYPWGISYVQAPLAHSLGVTGNGVKIAVLDTGIDRTHQDLSGTVSNIGYSLYSGGPFFDANGHGTHIAGIIAAMHNNIGIIGVAPNAQVYSVKVLNNHGAGTYTGIAQGIEWAIVNGMNIINMSFGGASNSPIVESIVNQAYNAGILLIAAADTSYGSGIGYPAQYNAVIGVGGVTQSGMKSPIHPAIEVYSPGANIFSTYPNNRYMTLSGTSMSAAHASGVAALYWSQYPWLTNQQIRSLLNSTDAIYQ